jgi:ankyrin repeat protein
LLSAVLVPGLAAPVHAQGVVVGGKEKPRPASAAPRLAPEDGADLLVGAALGGDVETVRSLLARGVDPKARGSLRKTPLRAATSVGCMTVPEKDVLAILDLLIERGADVNDVDEFGLGVLLMASQKCKAAVITRLLKAGADTEQRSPQGYSPLAMAFIVKNFDAARALVDHGARLKRESIAKLFPEPPADPEQAALVKRATAGR